MDKIAPYYKAVVALVVPFLTIIGASLLDGSDGGSSITGSEWITAAVTALLAGGAVFRIPNKDPEGEHQLESVQPPLTKDEQLVLGALSHLDVEDGVGQPHPDGGVMETGWLIAGACLIVIIVGIVWLVQNF